MPDGFSIKLKAFAIPAALVSLAEFTMPEHVPLVAVSGLCGGLCRWIAEKSSLWPTGLGNIIGGGLVAIFFWPIGNALLGDAFSRMEMDPITSQMLGSFVAGLLGMSLVGFILDLFKARRQEVVGGGDDDDKS